MEYDLIERGHNIYDHFKGVYPLTQLYLISRKLPRESHYVGAMYDDDDLAPTLDSMPTSSKFGLTGWSQEIELLHTISKGIESLLSRTIAGQSKNGKGPTVSPTP